MDIDIPPDLLDEEHAFKEGKSIASMYFRCNADAALHLIAVDRGAAEVTGYISEELVATGMMTLMDLVVPESRSELRYNIQQCIGERKAFASWFVLQRKDGSTAHAFLQGKANLTKYLELIDLEGYITAAKIESGEFTVDTSTVFEDYDIPSSVPAADPGYAYLLNYATEVLGLINTFGEIEYITPALSQLSSVMPTNHQLFTSIFAPNSTPIIDRSLQEVRQEGKEIEGLEVSIDNKEGIPTTAKLFLSPAGSHSGTILFRIEMAQSQHSREKIEKIDSDEQVQEDELYQHVFLTSTIATIITQDNVNTIIEANYQFLSLFEYNNKDEILNNSVRDLNIINEADIVRINDAAYISGVARPHPIEITTHLGDKRTVLASAQSLHLYGEKYIVYFFDTHSYSQGAGSHERQRNRTVSEELSTLYAVLQKSTQGNKTAKDAKCEALLSAVLYLHDPTCLADDGERIAIDAYLGKITKSYIESNESAVIEYEFICDHGLVFDRKLAQSCGTALVDLIASNLNYIFGDGGKMSVLMLRDQAEGNYRLSVTDIGLDSSHNDENQEPDIAIAREIAKSLRGTVEMKSTDKSENKTMTFPIPISI